MEATQSFQLSLQLAVAQVAILMDQWGSFLQVVEQVVVVQELVHKAEQAELLIKVAQEVTDLEKIQ
jgi:hypothetical protein